MSTQEELTADREMIASLQSGDKAAWNEFYARFDPLICSVTSWSKWHFPITLQQDLRQNIRLELTKCITSFKGDSSLEYFVKRICIHRCIDEVRRQVRERQFMMPMVQKNADGEEFLHEAHLEAGRDFDPILAVDLAERASELRRILDAFDTTCRTAIRYFYFEGLSYKDIAGKLGVSIITVGTRLGKCLNKLRTALSKDVFFREDICDSSDVR
jgi:RNA polymerase sigma factor (sigma-70 family)